MVIVNQRNETVFSYNQPQSKIAENRIFITGPQMEALERQLKRTGIDIQAVLDRYHLESMVDMTPEIYNKAMESLSITADKAA